MKWSMYSTTTDITEDTKSEYNIYKNVEENLKNNKNDHVEKTPRII